MRALTNAWRRWRARGRRPDGGGLAPAVPALGETPPVATAPVATAHAATPHVETAPAAPDATAEARVRWEVDVRARLDALAPLATTDDARALLDELAAGPGDAVRQLPSAAQEALAICNDPWASFAELARVCGTDPTVAQGLLRYANSAYYARAGQPPAVALGEAIGRVGVAGVQNVLLDVTVHGLLAQPGGELTRLVDLVWSHMVRTAPVARALAPAFRAEPERAYALGLLHDVGKLVVLDQAAALRARLRRTAQLPAPFVREALGALHEPLGALAALRWGLGPEAAAAIAGHHRAAPAPPDALAETLFLAERAELAATRGTPLDLGRCWLDGALGGDAVAAERALRAHYASDAPAAA